MQIGFGLSFNWSPFDPVTNPYNEAIGNFEAAYIDVGVTLDYQFSSRFNVVAALTGTHFSNGGSKQPNWGMNQLGIMAMLKYRFQKEDPPYTKYNIEQYDKNHEWLISGSWGIRNVHIDSPPDYPELADKYLRVNYSVITINSTYYRQISWKSKFGGGIDLVYDRSVSGQIDAGDGDVDNVDVPLLKEGRLGLFGAYEFVLHDISILANIGYSIIQKEDELPRLYQRVGVKYHFSDRFFAGLNVRFQDFGKANHLEFNLGYRMQWR
jgi:hypothetical protein